MAEYSKLPPEDLKMHYLACKEALVQVLGAAGGDAGSAPPAPGPDASGPPPAPADPTMKAEKGMAGQKPGESATSVPEGGMKDDPKANGENPLHKAEVEALNVKINQTNAAVEALVGAVKHVLEAPLRKSVISTADIAPPAADLTKLSRDEIRAKLKVVASSPTLSKSDRELITGYDLKTVKVDKIAHLLK
jgi:hypothetical protein